jgi:hypothetical protein
LDSWQKYSVQVDKANRMYLIIFSSSGLQVFFVKDNNAFYRGRALDGPELWGEKGGGMDHSLVTTPTQMK